MIQLIVYHRIGIRICFHQKLDNNNNNSNKQSNRVLMKRIQIIYRKNNDDNTPNCPCVRSVKLSNHPVRIIVGSAIAVYREWIISMFCFYSNDCICCCCGCVCGEIAHMPGCLAVVVVVVFCSTAVRG